MLKLSQCACMLLVVLAISGCVMINTSSGTGTNVSSGPDNTYTPTPDNPSSPINSDDENAAIQEMNDINAQNASMAAAEEQNEEAQQQATQDEINAMPVNNSNQW